MIVYVDEEGRMADILREELEDDGYEVKVFTEVDDALKFIEADVEAVDLLILDIMMPPGESFKDADTDDGLRTGVRFYQRVRQKSAALPVIMFTNVSAEDVKDQFPSQERCWYMEKKDYFPLQFVERVKEIVGPPPAAK